MTAKNSAGFERRTTAPTTPTIMSAKISRSTHSACGKNICQYESAILPPPFGALPTGRRS